jgi:hypothetical protein
MELDAKQMRQLLLNSVDKKVTVTYIIKKEEGESSREDRDIGILKSAEPFKALTVVPDKETKDEIHKPFFGNGAAIIRVEGEDGMILYENKLIDPSCYNCEKAKKDFSAEYGVIL